MKRSRFQTSLPTYSSLLRMPLPRRRWPWIVLGPHDLPRGHGTFSRFSARVIAFGEAPAAYSSKMRRTIAACSGLMRRSPRLGSPSSPMRFTTS
jgi:hypothetical protein